MAGPSATLLRPMSRGMPINLIARSPTLCQLVTTTKPSAGVDDEQSIGKTPFFNSHRMMRRYATAAYIR